MDITKIKQDKMLRIISIQDLNWFNFNIEAVWYSHYRLDLAKFHKYQKQGKTLYAIKFRHKNVKIIISYVFIHHLTNYWMTWSNSEWYVTFASSFCLSGRLIAQTLWYIFKSKRLVSFYYDCFQKIQNTILSKCINHKLLKLWAVDCAYIWTSTFISK